MEPERAGKARRRVWRGGCGKMGGRSERVPGAVKLTATVYAAKTSCEGRDTMVGVEGAVAQPRGCDEDGRC